MNVYVSLLISKKALFIKEIMKKDSEMQQSVSSPCFFIYVDEFLGFLGSNLKCCAQISIGSINWYG